MGERVELPVRTIHWSEPKRHFLVSIRSSSVAGNGRWVDYSRRREWDLLLNYYDEPPSVIPAADMVTYGGASKFPAAWQTNRDHDGFLAAYRAVFFLDNDIDLQFEDVDRLFAIFSEFELWLAQPSLSQGSHFSWPITQHQPSRRLRYTNFVEIMAPVLSDTALAKCLPTFNQSISGWGLDLIWPALLGNPTNRIAVIDEIEMTHPDRVDPANGRFYRYLSSIGVDPYAESERLAREYEVPRDYPTEQYGEVRSDNGDKTESPE